MKRHPWAWIAFELPRTKRELCAALAEHGVTHGHKSERAPSVPTAKLELAQLCGMLQHQLARACAQMASEAPCEAHPGHFENCCPYCEGIWRDE